MSTSLGARAAYIVLNMPGPTCRICSSPRRAEIDLDLVQGMTTTKVAEKYGDSQTTVARHKRRHLKPHLHAIAQIAAPVLPLSPVNAVAVIPTVGALLAKLGTTVEKLETLVDDAEKDGGIAVRAVSLRELRSGLVDATKLLAVLRPPEAPPASTIRASAVADFLASTDAEKKDGLLDRLLP